VSAVPRLYTIEPGTPFLEALASGILAQVGDAPEDLSVVTVLLPTRRACRSLAEMFLRLGDGRPMLLPRMTPLGDIDEDELEISGDIDLDPAIPGLRRQLLLSKLISAASADKTTPDQAARLAAELARLLDQVLTERLSFDGLAELAMREHAEHWQKTLDFLTILTEHWPKILEQEGAIDPAMRRNKLLEAQAAAWTASPPKGLVIAAGSTGSIPASADLLKVVAGLPKGAVVLPGIDRDASDAVWQALQPSHPQFGMAHLLAHMGVERSAVADWPSGVPVRTSNRRQLLDLALRPPGTEHPATEISADATGGMIRIDAPDPQAEARTIALIMRQTLETPEQTAALITPDRTLARRVTEELKRWDIAVDDSAGRPLSETPAGAYLRLTARMIADNLAPVSLLAACKHPLAGAGMATADFRSLVRTLEIQLLRGPRPGPGFAGLRAALAAEIQTAEKRGKDHRLKQLHALSPALAPLEEILKPFARLMDAPTAEPGKLLQAHIACAEALASTDNETGAIRLWAGDDGEAAAHFIAELADGIGVLAGDFDPAHYPAFLDALMGPRMVRPSRALHGRLHIWGNLEARLQQADVMILGGLNENTWPPEARPNPWMSRPMARAFGLPLPERRIGLAAHDFVQAAAAARIYLTRADRIEGTPTVPSRWLQRLDNLLRGSGLKDNLAAQDDWIGWARGLDEPGGKSTPALPPAPTPPLHARPRQLPVTRIRTLIRDPYAIYAERILRLRPLDKIDANPDARHKGIAIHDILDRFVSTYPGDMPDHAEQILIDIGRAEFDQLMAWPTVRALWWPRFERVAEAFIQWEKKRRAAGVRMVGSESDGRITLDIAGGEFVLTAKADRIDRLADGTLSIIDYKTGGAPTGPMVACGLEPQLPLEAVIAEAGGFGDDIKLEVTDLLYVLASGGREPLKEKRPQLKDSSVRQVIDDSLDGLKRLLSRYDMEDTPYRARTRVQYERYEGDYDHLARFKEWGIGGDEE